MKGLFKEILSYTQSDQVKRGLSLERLLNTELMTGMSRYEVRWGTHSDGHEHLGNAARFYQANHESWNRSNAMVALEAESEQAQVVLEIREFLSKLADLTHIPWFVRWQKSKLKLAKLRLLTLRVRVQETHRELDECNKIMDELQDEVRAKYPGGIEQAEPDIWKEVARYRAAKKRLGYKDEQLTHIPLDPFAKAELAIEQGMPEMALFLQHMEPEAVAAFGGVQQLLEAKKKHDKARLTTKAKPKLRAIDKSPSKTSN